MKDPNLFLLMWNELGLEVCINITNVEKDTVWAKLGDKEPPKVPIAQMMMRARTNPQRHYEIYTISTKANISQQDIIEFLTKARNLQLT
jgi:hypothetical protein